MSIKTEDSGAQGVEELGEGPTNPADPDDPDSRSMDLKGLFVAELAVVVGSHLVVEAVGLAQKPEDLH